MWGPNLEMFKWRLGNPEVKDRRDGCLRGWVGACVGVGVWQPRAQGQASLGWLECVCVCACMCVHALACVCVKSVCASPHPPTHPPRVPPPPPPGWRTSTFPISSCCAPTHPPTHTFSQGGEPLLFLSLHAARGDEGSPHPTRPRLRHRAAPGGRAHPAPHAQVGLGGGGGGRWGAAVVAQPPPTHTHVSTHTPTPPHPHTRAACWTARSSSVPAPSPLTRAGCGRALTPTCCAQSCRWVGGWA